MANEFCLAILEGDEIVIRIPVSALPDLAHHALSDGGYAIDEETAATRYAVQNPAFFAIEICAAWNYDAENGSTPLRRSFDKAICDAVDAGSESVEELCPVQAGGVSR